MPRKKAENTNTRAAESALVFYTPRGKRPQKFEKNEGISMTVPDEALSVKEMLLRHQQGLPIPGKLNEYYEDYDDVPHHMRPDYDLTDIDEVQGELDRLLELKEQADNERMERGKRRDNRTSGTDPERDTEEDGQTEHGTSSEAQQGAGEVSE